MCTNIIANHFKISFAYLNSNEINNETANVYHLTAGHYLVYYWFFTSHITNRKCNYNEAN